MDRFASPFQAPARQRYRHMANWVYAQEILTCAECLRALENRDYLSLIPERPDLFTHQPHELESTIARLHTHLARTQE